TLRVALPSRCTARRRAGRGRASGSSPRAATAISARPHSRCCRTRGKAHSVPRPWISARSRSQVLTFARPPPSGSERPRSENPQNGILRHGRTHPDTQNSSCDETTPRLATSSEVGRVQGATKTWRRGETLVDVLWEIARVNTVQVVLRKLGRGSRAVAGRLVRAPRKGSVVVIEFSDGMHEYVTTPVKRVLRLAAKDVFYIETVNSRYRLEVRDRERALEDASSG